MHAEIDDMLHQAKNSEEKAKKAMVDAARLADELRAEQEHSTSQDKNKRALESQVMELEQRLAEANDSAARSRLKRLRKLLLLIWPSTAKLNRNLKRLRTGPKWLEINSALFVLPQLACNGQPESRLDSLSNNP